MRTAKLETPRSLRPEITKFPLWMQLRGCGRFRAESAETGPSDAAEFRLAGITTTRASLPRVWIRPAEQREPVNADRLRLGDEDTRATIGLPQHQPRAPALAIGGTSCARSSRGAPSSMPTPQPARTCW